MGVSELVGWLVTWFAVEEEGERDKKCITFTQFMYKGFPSIYLLIFLLFFVNTRNTRSAKELENYNSKLEPTTTTNGSPNDHPSRRHLSNRIKSPPTQINRKKEEDLEIGK